MSDIYSPAFFREKDFDLTLKVMKENAFAILQASQNPEGFSHLPFVLKKNQNHSYDLVSHMARANPHWEELTNKTVRVIFSGPHSYISPAWYVPKVSNVPTWNYVTVHAVGKFEIISEQSQALEMMKMMVGEFETKYGTGWTMPEDMTSIHQLMNHIVVFKISEANFESKFKLSQQHSVENRERTIASLKHHGQNDLAEWMELTRKKELL